MAVCAPSRATPTPGSLIPHQRLFKKFFAASAGRVWVPPLSSGDREGRAGHGHMEKDTNEGLRSPLGARTGARAPETGGELGSLARGAGMRPGERC